jgi:hypothetical protein
MAEGIGTNINWQSIPLIAQAMKEAAPLEFARSIGKAFYKIGKIDTDTMRQQVSGAFKVNRKGFVNSFKFKAADSRTVTNLNQLYLSEYTGAKPFRIFQTGGNVVPTSAKTLTILTDAAKTAGGRRKYPAWQIRAMIDSGEARIIKTPRGAMIVREKISYTKTGKMKHGSRVDVLAILKPVIHQKQRIDFFKNYDSNEAAHESIYSVAMEEALQRTIEGKGK